MERNHQLQKLVKGFEKGTVSIHHLGGRLQKTTIPATF